MKNLATSILCVLIVGASEISASNTVPSSGNVGIGTTSPDRPLVISSVGNSQPAGESTVLIEGQSNKERFGIHSFSGDPGFQASRAGGTLSSPSATPSNAYLSYLGGGGYSGSSWTGNNGLIAIKSSESFSNTNRGVFISFQTTQSGTTSRTEKVRIADNGNVGIGTVAPTHKLAVNGTVRAKEVIVETNWSDFVFEDGYVLRSLSDVESHIQKHGHLPDVPSAAEIQENGLAVAEAQTVMMQKIEELTLYAIEKDREVADLNARLAKLEALLLDN